MNTYIASKRQIDGQYNVYFTDDFSLFCINNFPTVYHSNCHFFTSCNDLWGRNYIVWKAKYNKIIFKEDIEEECNGGDSIEG